MIVVDTAEVASPPSPEMYAHQSMARLQEMHEKIVGGSEFEELFQDIDSIGPATEVLQRFGGPATL